MSRQGSRGEARRKHLKQGNGISMKTGSQAPKEDSLGEGGSGVFPAIPPMTGGKNDRRRVGCICPLTKVVVVHHRVGRPQPGPLLSEVVAEFEKCCIFFQHAHDLHFHLVAQGLAL